MKKIVAVFLCILVFFSLAACGAPKQVPDQTIAWAVEDYLKGCGYGTVTESSYEASHNYDDATKTDTVDIALMAVFPNASFKTSCQATYQYDKSSGLWSVVRGGEWAPVSVNSYRLTVSPRSILKTIKETDATADFDNKNSLRNELNLESLTEAVDDWFIEGQDSVFAYCESADPETAYNVFLKAFYTYCLKGKIKNFKSEEVESAVGENYHCLMWHLDADIYMVCQDNTVLIFGSSDRETIENIVDNIGFIPDMIWEPFDVESGIKRMLYTRAESFLGSGYYDSAEKLFIELGDFEDSASRAEEAVLAQKASEYDKAEALLKKGKIEEAIAAFHALGDYKDCKARIEEIIEAQNSEAYNNALSLLAQKRYDDAINAFANLGDYKDSREKIEEVVEAQKAAAYESALFLYEQKKYDDAITAFTDLGDYGDSKEKVKEVEEAKKAAAYENALSLLKLKNYDDAINAFLSLDGYKDSEKKAKEAVEERNADYYEKAITMMDEGNYERAYETLLELSGYSDVDELMANNKELLKVKHDRFVAPFKRKGEVVEFGRYNFAGVKEPIEWIVLDANDNSAMLFSKYILDFQPYHDQNNCYSWAESTLRSWLNSTFYETAFNEVERKAIKNTTVDNSNRQNRLDKYPANGGTTVDKVFILSATELKDLIPYNGKSPWIKSPSWIGYRLKKYNDGSIVEEEYYWWLRSAGEKPMWKNYVNNEGTRLDDGTLSKNGIRPVVWVDLNSDYFYIN